MIQENSQIKGKADIDTTIEHIQESILHENYSMGLGLVVDLLQNHFKELTTSQTQSILTLALQSIFYLHQHPQKDDAQAPVTNQQIYNFTAFIHGLSDIYDKKPENLFPIASSPKLQHFITTTYQQYKQKTTEEVLKIRQQQEKEDYLQVLRQQREYLLKNKKYKELIKILVRDNNDEDNDLLKMAQNACLDYQYQRLFIGEMKKYPDRCQYGNHCLNEAERLQQVWMNNIIGLLKKQNQQIQKLSNDQTAIEIFEWLQKIYIKALKTIHNSWDLILKIRINLQQIRNLHTQFCKNLTSSTCQKQFIASKEKKSRTFDALVKMVKAINTQDNQFSLFFQFSQKNTVNSIVGLFEQFIQINEDIVNKQIQIVSETFKELTPFVSFSFKQIFNLHQLETSVFMSQFQKIKEKIEKIQSLQDQSEIQKQLNQCLKLLVGIYDLKAFQLQEVAIKEKYCQRLADQIKANKKQGFLIEEAALTILLIWLEQKCDSLDELSDLKRRLESSPNKSVEWYNIMQKMIKIFIQILIHTQNDPKQIIANLNQLNKLISSSNIQYPELQKFKSFLKYLKIRKQKHFKRILRQIDYKAFSHSPKLQIKRIQSLDEDQEIVSFWEKQKQTKMAQNNLSIALLMIRNIPSELSWKQRKKIQKNADQSVEEAIKTWEKYDAYNLNSISRVKLIRYWISRNNSIQAYKELRKIKHYKPEDINFYSGDSYYDNQKNHQRDVKFFQNLIKSIQRIADQNRPQSQIRSLFHEIVNESEEKITYDSLTIFLQVRLINKIRLKIDKDEQIKSKLLQVKENQLSRENILYDSQFFKATGPKQFDVFNYKQLYKSNKIIVYESCFQSEKRAHLAKKIIQNIWTISHQNICTVQLIEKIQEKEYQFRVYLSLQAREIEKEDINFQKLIKRLIEAVFYLGRYIPQQIICNEKALHLLSANQFQINPLECFQLRNSQRSTQKILLAQKELLMKARRSFLKHLRYLNKDKGKDEEKFKIPSYLLPLFDQYIEHITKRKIIFHLDPEASFYHPFFWNNLEISKFIDEFQAEMQYLSIIHSDSFKKQLDIKGNKVINGDWGVGLDSQIVRDILYKQSLQAQGKYRNYIWDPKNYEQISYLVNCIRNSIHHFIENEGFGRFKTVDSIVIYFMDKYPQLLSFLWTNYDILHKRFKSKFAVK